MNVLLLGLFAVQHSVMARPGFKRWWTRFVPHAVERSTYVLLASLALLLLYWQWRPIADAGLDGREPALGRRVQASFWLGWASCCVEHFLINHFELFGLRQVLRGCAQRAAAAELPVAALLQARSPPDHLGFLLAFWSTPAMTAGHLLFALATTGYILIGIFFEERDLVALFGDQYRRYRKQVSMLVPLPGRRFSDDAVEPPQALEPRPR